MDTQPDFAELSSEAQARVDDACDAFETAWRGIAAESEATGNEQASRGSTHWPTIDSYLQHLSPNERAAALRELVPIDVSYRRRCGAPVALGTYAKFTELDSEWLTGIVVNPDGRTQQAEQPKAERTAAATKPKLPPPTLEVFIERLVTSRLHNRETVQREVDSLGPGERTAVALGERLVSRGMLTPFQFSSLLRLARPGLVFGDYIILSPIGRGGMGAVYRARHRRMDRIVAIKVLPPSAARDPQIASRFSREVRAIARLSHPNIVAAHDAGEDSGVAYLVMELIDGTDLASRVKNHGPLSVAHAVECLIQSAEGLEYAHSQGVIHRDIKPSNLIECREVAASKEPVLRIKVLDLGLARFQSDGAARDATALTRSGMMFGTPEYMAPEQAVSEHGGCASRHLQPGLHAALPVDGQTGSVGTDVSRNGDGSSAAGVAVAQRRAE